MSVTRRIQAQLGWWSGLFASVAGALIGQSDLLHDPWRGRVTIVFVVTTALSGYMIRRPDASKE